jgi:serine/threonine protein kinase
MSERSIFLEALEQTDPVERAALLDRICGDNAVLRRRVEALLQALDQAGSFMDSHADARDASGHGPASASAEPRPLVEGPGTRIGPYKLLEPIGQGGMGVVFMAEQETPVRRKVALKIIKPGMDSAQVIARFEAERQALALMDHPHIAKVLDAGTTESGRPYFVMELVKGVPITEYCDGDQLTPRERLELFVPVCLAIQHAHQKGIIHRDIKPSNVLVTLHDGTPIPKVIDFGVAKAIDQRLTERTLFTQFGVIVGTLEYMSPEQAEMGAIDVDTRSDIYTLGVLLYELLTGSTPLERAKIRQAAYVEILRQIREEEPLKPSTRISESKDTLATISALRRTERARLSKLVRGELDWIVMKALDKDRSRRYETADEFARDIHHYLDDEPVEAGPPSAAYKLRKFARRHRAALGTIVAFTLLLLIAAVASAFLAMMAARAERQAVQAARDAAAQARRAIESQQAEVRQRQEAEDQRSRAKKAEQSAQAEAAKARRSEAEARTLLEFYQNKVLAAARPAGQEGGMGRDVSLRQALDTAESAIAKSFDKQPEVEASIRETLGQNYIYLGEMERAIHQLERAVTLRRQVLGPDHPDTLSAMNRIAVAYQNAGRLSQAIALFEESLQRRRSQFGPDHPDTLASMSHLATAYRDTGRLAEALPLLEQALSRRRATLGPDHPETLQSMSNLAQVYHAAGRSANALPLLEQTLDRHRAKLGPDHPNTLGSMKSLADSYADLGRQAEALKLREQTLALARAKLGPDHPDTLACMNSLANSYAALSRHAEALRLREETLGLRKAKLGPDHPDTLISMNDLAVSYADLGRQAEALKLFEETLALQKAKLGPDHPDTLISMNSLAAAYQDAGRLDEALALFEETLKRRQAKLGSDHPNTLQSMGELAMVYLSAGRLAEALRLLEEALKRQRTKLGPDHPETQRSKNNLALAYRKAGRTAEAEALLREARVISEKKATEGWRAFDARSELGNRLLGQKKYAEAEPLLIQGYEGMKTRAAEIPVQSKDRLARAGERIIQLYDAWGKQDEADAWRKRLEADRKKAPNISK